MAVSDGRAFALELKRAATRRVAYENITAARDSSANLARGRAVNTRCLRAVAPAECVST